MSLPINGFNISLPLDIVGRALAKFRFGSGPIPFRKGAKYQLNGEWFIVDQVLSTSLVLRLAAPNATITEEK